VKKIIEKSYSLENIKKYVSFTLDKEKLIEEKLWNVGITMEKFEPIFKRLRLDDYSVLRTNLIAFYNK